MKTKQVAKARFKDFSPQKKLELSMRLYYSAREIKIAALKHFHPDWNEEKIESEVKKIFMNART